MNIRTMSLITPAIFELGGKDSDLTRNIGLIIGYWVDYIIICSQKTSIRGEDI